MQQKITLHVVSEEKILLSALKTIVAEKNGLVALERVFIGQKQLALSFISAVKRVLESSGRVIVTGLGKSGHIGIKIASTLASTGTSAFFIHAAEANHGDLGMIRNDDVIFAISRSGETVELKGIINHSRRFSIPLIALTEGKKSWLACNADTLLLLPKLTEACPHGLTPTTSAVMQLAVGDALALALLEARNFSVSDFKVFHPGGSLGASLCYVSDIMHKKESLPIVSTGTLMTKAMEILAEKHLGCVIVTQKNGKVAGIVTDGDLARNINRDLSQASVDEVMTSSPKTIKSDTLTATAIALINKHQVSALLVTEYDKPVGIIHFHDLLRISTHLRC